MTKDAALSRILGLVRGHAEGVLRGWQKKEGWKFMWVYYDGRTPSCAVFEEPEADMPTIIQGSGNEL